MSQLIDDLLAFSRLGRQELNKHTVNPTTLARESIVSLGTELEGRQVEFTVAELSPCQADLVLLRQVFTNLLENAIKFSSPRETARIEVGCDEEDGKTIYWVRDNGVGFDMQYADKLFGVFQRLHPAGEFEGTGVGLAIVKRIVQRHGGEIWAEAEPDIGATFYFTLPEMDSY
jgi:light-regulated signal transduction histidine kinase (bacteriophytochrome)